VHGGNTAADDPAADRRTPASWREHRDGQPDSRDDAGGEQRHDRQIDVISDRHSGPVSQHRQKVCRPDAAAGRGSRRGEPDRAGTPLGRTRPMEQGDRCQARQETDDAGDRNQAPVMLRRQAVENPKQPYPSSGCVQSAYWLVNIVIRFLNEHSRALRVTHLARPVDCADRFSESAIATRCPA
jgi:hypothetical protein